MAVIRFTTRMRLVGATALVGCAGLALLTLIRRTAITRGGQIHLNQLEASNSGAAELSATPREGDLQASRSPVALTLEIDVDRTDPSVVCKAAVTALMDGDIERATSFFGSTDQADLEAVRTLLRSYHEVLLPKAFPGADAASLTYEQFDQGLPEFAYLVVSLKERRMLSAYLVLKDGQWWLSSLL